MKRTRINLLLCLVSRSGDDGFTTGSSKMRADEKGCALSSMSMTIFGWRDACRTRLYSTPKKRILSRPRYSSNHAPSHLHHMLTNGFSSYFSTFLEDFTHQNFKWKLIKNDLLNKYQLVHTSHLILKLLSTKAYRWTRFPKVMLKVFQPILLSMRPISLFQMEETHRKMCSDYTVTLATICWEIRKH